MAVTSIDKDLKAKQAEKYDHELEKQVCDWIEAITGEKKGDAPVELWLHDGQVLCHLVNKIEPGVVKKINTQAMPFKQMENITNFMNVCRAWGVAEYSMFSTPDLHEAKNMGSVIMAIYTLGGVVQAFHPDFDGPKLGVKINVPSRDVKRKKIQATQSDGYRRSTQQPDATPKFSVGYAGAGAVTDPIHVKKLVDCPLEGQPMASPTRHEGGKRSSLGVPATSGPGRGASPSPRNSPRGSVTQADVEKDVIAWIEAITGEKKGDSGFGEWLHDGKVLCSLVNKIKEGTIRKVNEQSMPFKQMENITNFMHVARAWGVPEASMFGTADLYEEKNLPSVARCLYAFGGAVQKHCHEFNGPKLGLVAVDSRDVKRNLGACTDQSEGMRRAMEVERPRGMRQ